MSCGGLPQPVTAFSPTRREFCSGVPAQEVIWLYKGALKSDPIKRSFLKPSLQGGGAPIKMAGDADYVRRAALS